MSVQLRLLEAPEFEDVTPDTARRRLWRGRSGSAPLKDRSIRRLLGIELLLVLGLFPLGPTMRAIVAMIQRIETHSDAVTNVLPALHPTWLAYGIEFFIQFTNICVAGLILYLLARNEGVSAINLGKRHWRMDLALIIPIFGLAFVIPQTAGSVIIHLLHANAFAVNPNVALSNALGTTVGFMAALTAGIVEEVVVLGYLVHRLEQRRWDARWIVLVAVAVRVSYHLYYGWGAVQIAFWALASVVLYRRVRRLLPFIICHVIWDCGATLFTYYRMAWVVLAILFALVSMETYKRWGSWNAAPVTNDP